MSGSRIKVTNYLGDVTMAREKVVALVSLCLVLVFASFNGWLYVRMRGLEDRISGLENSVNGFTQQCQDLQNQLAEFASIFSQAEQLIVENLVWKVENADATFTPTFTVRNTGTSNIALVAVFVNGEIAEMNASSNLLSPRAQATINITKTGGFRSGMSYEFIFVTAGGNQFFYVATAPAM